MYWLETLKEISENNPRREQHLKEFLKSAKKEGFEKFLHFLDSPQGQSAYKNLFGNTRSSFYMRSFFSIDCKEILESLLKHLQAKRYFPFHELHINASFLDDSPLLIDLLRTNHFSKVYLDSKIRWNAESLLPTLQSLTEDALREGWATPLIIRNLDTLSLPALEKDLSLKHAASYNKSILHKLTLLQLYTQLHNVISVNQRAKQNAELGQTLKNNNALVVDSAPRITAKSLYQQLFDTMKEIYSHQSHWPLKRAGGLQIQQQQEQEQEQQQQQQQTINTAQDHSAEEELVSYVNITNLLADVDPIPTVIFDKKSAQNRRPNTITISKIEGGTTFYKLYTLNGCIEGALPCDSIGISYYQWVTTDSLANYESQILKAIFLQHPQADIRQYAVKGSQDESTLQRFFRTWISAPPFLRHPEVIRFMTQNAARALLNHPIAAISGLHPDNLPEGFFIQRNEKRELILCYSPYNKEEEHTPLTISLKHAPSPTIPFRGDFRQLNLEYYVAKPISNESMTDLDWENIVLFALLQIEPRPTVKASKDYQEFSKTHPLYWFVYQQLERLYGKEQGEYLFNQKKDSLSLIIKQVKAVALERILDTQDRALLRWLERNSFIDFLPKLGQIYNQYGSEGVYLFLNTLKSIEEKIGNKAFIEFFGLLLTCNDRFVDYLNPVFFKALEDMLNQLTENPNAKAWFSMAKCHTALIRPCNLAELWTGFSHFLRQLQQLKLTLPASAFDKLPPGNMLIIMDRILAYLNALDTNKQQAFLNDLEHADLTQGGLCILNHSSLFEPDNAPKAKAGLRRLEDKDKPKGLLRALKPYEQHVWMFLQEHVLISKGSNAEQSLSKLLEFLKEIYRHKTPVDELSLLLRILEKTPANRYWHADYFHQFLQTLSVSKHAFPVSLFASLLKNDAIKAHPFEDVPSSFPANLSRTIQSIIQLNNLSRAQQRTLIHRVLVDENSRYLLGKLLPLLEKIDDDAILENCIQSLSQEKDLSTQEAYLDLFQRLIDLTPPEGIAASWPQTRRLLFNVLAEPALSPFIVHLMTNINSNEALSAERQTLILHILAWSSMEPALSERADVLSDLKHKAVNLVQKNLLNLPEGTLNQLAALYPNKPAPSADRLRRLLKQHQQGKTLTECINEFLANPSHRIRPEHQILVNSRQDDFARILNETRINREGIESNLTQEEKEQITSAFTELKELEAGRAKIRINGVSRAIADMNQETIQETFHHLCIAYAAAPSRKVYLEMLALVFEAIYQTTSKYPHLAQQLLLIVNGLQTLTPANIITLDTGEGKSHGVAMIAAMLAGLGYDIDVCTAKPTLAQRDFEDYHAFFSFLNLSAQKIKANSKISDYTESKIRYTTINELSHFFDGASCTGQAIPIDPSKRIGLFDEIHFIRDLEGRIKQINYALSSGKTPKEMAWIYHTIRRFYEANEVTLSTDGIGLPTLLSLLQTLHQAADDPEKENVFVELFAYDTHNEAELKQKVDMLIKWLQSAHIAKHMSLNEAYAIDDVEENLAGEIYPLEISIPFSAANQLQEGSTFSDGVNQLLASFRGLYAGSENQIISSQNALHLMKTLYAHWIGFTATFSALQKQRLISEKATTIISMPTNQPSLRTWHRPFFEEKDETRIEHLADLIRDCIKNKQSFLCTGKNDKQVLHLQEALKAHLSEEERQQLIFHTKASSDAAANQTLFKKKRDIEQAVAGEKQRASGIFAAGLSLGDDLAVDVVIVLDPLDKNDLIQKGGRTGRNNKPGQVYQLYIQPQMEKEYAHYYKRLDEHQKAQLDTIKLDDKEVETLEKLLLLREYGFYFDHELSDGQNDIRAQFSSWGMQCINAIPDTLRHAKRKRFAHFLEQLAEVSSDASLSTQAKITNFQAKAIMLAQAFTEECARQDILLPNFQLTAYTEVLPSTFIPETNNPSYTKAFLHAEKEASARSLRIKLEHLDYHLSPSFSQWYQAIEQQCSEDYPAKPLQRLVDATNEWCLKENKKYQPALKALWSLLNKADPSLLPALYPMIDWLLDNSQREPGKEWFLLLEIIVKEVQAGHLNAAQIIAHKDSIKAFWDACTLIEKAPLVKRIGKRNKIALFKDYLAIFVNFLDNNLPELIIDQLFDLSANENTGPTDQPSRQDMQLNRLLFLQTLYTLSDKRLNIGLNRYLAYCKKILACDKPHSMYDTRQLSAYQHAMLFQMTYELEIIHTDLNKETTYIKETAYIQPALVAEADNLLKTYHQQAFFKSASRIAQHQELTLALNGFNKGQHSHLALLEVILDHKLKAIDSDYESTKTRWNIFQMNRNGRSRYYNTLNQIEELILQDWVLKGHSEPLSQEYQHFALKEIHAVFQRLNRLLRDYSSSRPEIMALKTLSESFNALDELDMGKVIEFNQFIKALQNEHTHLPKHIATLANELLIRSEALMEHALHENKDYALSFS